jgi:flavodoxin
MAANVNMFRFYLPLSIPTVTMRLRKLRHSKTCLREIGKNEIGIGIQPIIKILYVEAYDLNWKIKFTNSEESDVSEKENSIISRRGLLKIGSVTLLSAIVMPMLGNVTSAYAASAGGKMLIIYYSWGGNTRTMATQIQSLTGADIFELKTIDPYPAEYRPTTEQAKREQESGYRPPLAVKIENLADYDTIFIGSPNWWGTLAMPFFTFLEEHNLSGKTLIPFVTHEGSGFGSSLSDLRKLCPNATILEGLAVRGGRVRNAQPEVAQGLKKIGITK